VQFLQFVRRFEDYFNFELLYTLTTMNTIYCLFFLSHSREYKRD